MGEFVLRRGSIRSKPEEVQRTLDVEEAAAELEKSRDGFLVFRNVESGSMNVLVRRKNGSFGLIQD